MCRYTSIFLKQVLQIDCGLASTIVGGRPRSGFDTTTDGVYGFIDSNNCYQDHCWLKIDKLHLIVDLTADQFGDAEITITETGNRRYRSNLIESAAPLKQDLIKLARTSNLWLQKYQKYK